LDLKTGSESTVLHEAQKAINIEREQLTLALRRIFSDPVSLSDFSTLKWHSK